MPSAGADLENLDLSQLWECKKYYNHFGKYLKFLKKLNMHSPYDPLQIFSPSLQVVLICTSHVGMFIAASFVITPNWKQPKSLSIGKWLNYGISLPWTALFSNKKE